MPDVPTTDAAVRWHPLDSTSPDALAPSAAHVLARVDHRPDTQWFNCPLPSLGGDFDSECWTVDTEVTHGEAHGWAYSCSDRVAFATRHIDDGGCLDNPQAIQQAAFDAYTQLFALQRTLGLAHVQRVWHWLSGVTAGKDDDQRYKRFCRGRAEALDMPDHGMTTLPPATLVTGHQRGVRMHVLIGDQPFTPVENPRQISAYDYPRQYGARAPAFARAGRVDLAGTPYLLISGTASIIGHESRHVGDVDAQTHEALDNVVAVMESANAWDADKGLSTLECLKAYVRDPDDAAAILAITRARAPDVPVALLHAPLCREELLIEFEAQMSMA